MGLTTIGTEYKHHFIFICDSCASTIQTTKDNFYAFHGTGSYEPRYLHGQCKDKYLASSAFRRDFVLVPLEELLTNISKWFET